MPCGTEREEVVRKAQKKIERDVVLPKLQWTISKALLNRLFRLAPLDFHDPGKPERSLGLQAMYRHFRIPAEFILERMQSVTHSFGSYMDNGAAYGDYA